MYKVSINRLPVNEETEIKALKKEFRKKLMTGGAVLEMHPELSLEKQNRLLDDATAEAGEPGISRLLLVAFAEQKDLSPCLAQKLSALNIKDIDRALFRRPGLLKELRAELLKKEHIRSIERSFLEESLVSTFSSTPSESILRKYFVENIGSEPASQAKRLALLSLENLPKDLVFLMQRDPDKRIRFEARGHSS